MKKIPRIIFKDNTMYQLKSHTFLGWDGVIATYVVPGTTVEANIFLNIHLQHVKKHIEKQGYRLPTEVERLFYAQT